MKIISTILLIFIVGISNAQTKTGIIINGHAIADTSMSAKKLVVFLPNGTKSWMTLKDSVWHINDTIGTINALCRYLNEQGQRFSDFGTKMYNRINSKQAQIDSLTALLIKKEKKKIKPSSPDLTNHSEITAETLKH